ncbi:MAG: HD domain-containing protein [Bergeyella sp.]
MEKIITTPKQLIQQAKDFAFDAHSNHYFPCGRKYTTHLETVAELSRQAFQHDASLNEGILLSTAYLHDSAEDTSATIDDIYKIFGRDIGNAVSALTKDKTLPKNEQIKNSLQQIIAQPKEVWIVKLADRVANLYQTLLLTDHKWSRDYKEYYRNEALLINKILGKSSEYLSQKLLNLSTIYNRM